MRRLYYLACVLFVADAITTLVVLSHGGATEGNPITAALIAVAGPIGGLGLSVAVRWAAAYAVIRCEPAPVLAVALSVAAVMTGAFVANNLLVLAHLSQLQ